MAVKKLLLVEGEFDQSFYKHFCKLHSLEAHVTVAPPKQVGGSFNTKQGAINHLTTLLPLLNDGQYERMGMIVDADAVANGSGYQATVSQVAEQLEPFEFNKNPTKHVSGGLLFSHKNGLADFGLWVMPDNRSEGILEDWIAQSIHPDEKPLFANATTTVRKLKPPKFAEIRRRKSEIATWLAWQDRPGEGLYYAVTGENLLDTNCTHYSGLVNWLTKVFR